MQLSIIIGQLDFSNSIFIIWDNNAYDGQVMGLKGRRVHMIEELTETIISFQRWAFVIIVMSQEFIVNPKLFTRLIACTSY